MVYLEYKDQKSHKFWEGTCSETTLTTRWGKVGTDGQTKTKEVKDGQAALDKAATAKRKKGYTEPGDTAAPVEEAREVQTAQEARFCLKKGTDIQVKGSGSAVYTLKNDGGVYSCSCPAWRNQSNPIDLRTCKHLRKILGDEHENERVGGKTPENKDEKDVPPIMLAATWKGEDPTGWLLSEKLDGVRAWWDGEKFVSRLGNVYHAPKWFIEGLPNEVLDGELFAGRGNFQRCVSIVRRYDAAEDWQEVKFMVFDAPKRRGDFVTRLQWAEQQDLGKWAAVLEHTPCDSQEHMDQLLEALPEDAEGLMVKDPASKYEDGRSNKLLKVKQFIDDEAIVTGYTAGKGRHKGRTGALMVRNRDGKNFKVGAGLTDQQRENPPEVGTVVHYRYFELTKAGVPRHPTFHGVRVDISPEEFDA